MRTFRKTLFCGIVLSLLSSDCAAYTAPSDLEVYSFLFTLFIGITLSFILTIVYLLNGKAGARVAAWILTGLTVCAMLTLLLSGGTEPVAWFYLLLPAFCIILIIRKTRAVAYRKWLAEVEEEERQRLGKR